MRVTQIGKNKRKRTLKADHLYKLKVQISMITMMTQFRKIMIMEITSSKTLRGKENNVYFACQQDEFL